MITRLTIIPATALVLCTATGASAQQRQHQPLQQQHQREQAREPYQSGIEHLRNERLEAAERAFTQATAIDPAFEMAHYMLGRTHLAQKRYASAVYALTKARDLYLDQATKVFESKNEIQSRRRQWLAEIDLLLQDLRAVNPQTFQIQEQIRQLEERKRQVENLQRGVEMRPGTLVPAFVSLSLGSALFRAGKLPDAEKAYLDAVAADPKVGEAHNNLAVVYMETRRYEDAERAVKNAEKTGLRVPQALKDEIRKRKEADG
ncbi:hypothetical protein BH23ACI1_BH23ACI1_26990 [soil metagenome]|nr:tetratricopeptide repeat protein [Gemmatimonadaceae bacterium]